MELETLCELTPFQRLAYRLLTPLLTGAALLAAVVFLFVDPLKDREVPDWMSHLLFRIGVSAYVLAFMGWISWRVSESYAWVKVGDGALHMKSLWTGKVTLRRMNEIANIIPYLHRGKVVGCRIRFRDGLCMSLEGRLGFRSETNPGKWFTAASNLPLN